MLIIYNAPGSIGWSPITYMVNLAAELLEAELVVLNDERPGFLRKLESIFLRRQKQKSNESLLLVCQYPRDLLSLITIKDWRNRFKYISAWIIDSFWMDRIPKTIKLSRLFDHLFVTTEEDIDEWTRLMNTPTTLLPWGTDALRLGGKNPERKWDLTRIGRQPPEWENDSITEQLCSEKGLSFHGRLKGDDDAVQNQKMLMNLYRQSKFLLAFSNTANPTYYTHPTRDYLTARWTDALACGSIVAGIPPREPSINRLLWNGATLDLGTTKIEDGIHAILAAAHGWTTDKAEKNYQQALKRLDWRWRFATIAEFANVPCKRLNDEIRLLSQKIDELE